MDAGLALRARLALRADREVGVRLLPLVRRDVVRDGRHVADPELAALHAVARSLRRRGDGLGDDGDGRGAARLARALRRLDREPGALDGGRVADVAAAAAARGDGLDPHQVPRRPPEAVDEPGVAEVLDGDLVAVVAERADRGGDVRARAILLVGVDALRRPRERADL